MATIRTLDFLPEIFQTTPNQQFLSSTLDVLVQQPDFNRVQGFIGSKFGYGVKSTDQYIKEPNSIRTNYQLEPSIVFTKTGTSKAVDVLTYPGIIDALKLNGAATDNHNLLFSSEFYSWDSFVDLDKMINYSQYYWIPEGPEAVTVTNSVNYSQLTYTVTSTGIDYTFVSDKFALSQGNPEITLVRGGTYEFNINQNTDFWIQTIPGTSGIDSARVNQSTREIFGVSNNGIMNGTLTFNVPFSDAQNSMVYPKGLEVDLVATMNFADLQDMPAQDVTIDGVGYLDNKTIIFYGAAPLDTGTISGSITQINKHYYTVSYVLVDGVSTIQLSEAGLLPDNEAILIRTGTEYIGREFVKNSYDYISLIPIVTASYDTLYYQDGTDPNKVGVIKLVDTATSSYIDVNNILGKTTYTSPNGITFTNGLKITFQGNVVPESYLQDNYYVEGVGSSIVLVPESALSVPEQFAQVITVGDTTVRLPVDQDYLTINRGALNRNAWSRSNRWFHADVLKLTIANNVSAPLASAALSNSSSMAKRPILEFYPNLKLFNYGSVDCGAVTYIDNNSYDAFNQVAGQVSFRPDGSTSAITNGTRIIFAADNNLEVRSKIYEAQVETVAPTNSNTLTTVLRKIDTQVRFAIPQTTVPPTVGRYYTVAGNSNSSYNGTYIVTDSTQSSVTLLYPADPGIFGNTATTITVQPEIVLVPVVDIKFNDMISVLSGDTFGGKTFYFDGSEWNESQQKNNINQPPLFDLFDYLGNSLGDPHSYPSSSFVGCTLLEYKKGTGTNDSILGFPISYTSINNLGDVEFNISLNSDTFNYSLNGVSTTALVKTAYAYEYTSNTNFIRKIGWQTAADLSYQNQVFDLQYTGIPGTPTFTVDIAMKDPATTKWPTIVVYSDNVRLDPTGYTVTTTSNSTTVTLTTTPEIGTPVVIMLYSDQVSKIGYYEIPPTLESNPFNQAIGSITLGDVRGHYKSICNNISTLTGIAFGANNYRDLGNLVPFGTRIVQNSAPLVLPAAFIRNNDYNFFNATTFNAYEYDKFKNLLVSSIDTLNIDLTQPAPGLLDTILGFLTASGLDSSSFFWSDMLPCKTPTYSNTYSFKTNLPISFFQLNQIYDFTKANYNSVLVYLTRTTVDQGTTITQLVRGIDYIVSDTTARLEIVADLLPNDTITINEYAQTYGNFVPSTPTKLGLYPAFIPEVVLDDTYTTPTYFIRGHDGSQTKLYGDYVNELLTDLRDKVLLEFELRVFNNLKVSSSVSVGLDQLVPGKDRDVGYTYNDYLSVYSTLFLNWVGTNRINYTTQNYDAFNEKTWNYSGSSLKSDGSLLTSGNWKGIYLWLYDTVYPHTRPWEMLGLTIKPTWWDSYYGAAPYTSENTVMWTDISNGFVYNNGDSYINKQRIRPDLLSMIPVDNQGNLILPFSNFIGSYNFEQFKNNWKVGDMGPTEYSYRSSSAWPFDLMKIAALMRPAKFFTYNIDLDVYSHNQEFGQWLVYGRLRTNIGDPNNLLNFYGTDATAAEHSYLNWIIDYQKQFGMNGTSQIVDLFTNSDVRLSYRMAGFSDKTLLNFMLEMGSASANSLLVPEDSYSVLLYNNQPTDTLIYSPVIIQISNNGFRVYGNKQVNAYFITSAPKLGIFDTIAIDTVSAQVPRNYFNDKTITYPYGAEFETVDDLLTFIRGYGIYLENQGFQFNGLDNGIVTNWTQMLYETLYWIKTGWEVGSIININPANSQLVIDNGNSIVQPLTLQKENFILNQNLIPIALNDLAIDRQGTQLSIKTLNAGDSISFFNATISTIEHVIVFDNTTLFGDLIYNPITGLRQQRIFMKGSKSAGWNGTLSAAGFIISQDNIEDWKANTKYVKGTVVSYKNSYWMANIDVVQPSPTFDKTYWDETSYDMVQQNMLPNPSTKSVEAIKYYNPNQANLANDADLLSFSLIGYRPRPYLSEAELDDPTQVNLYKSMIESKGTTQSANGLNGITLNDNQMSYTVHENWAIKNSEYSGLNNHNFVQITLDQTQLTGNPSIVSIVGDTYVVGSQQQVPLNQVKNYARNISNTSILSTLSESSIVGKIPTAGYVNVDDVVELGYNLSSLTSGSIYAIYRGDFVWLANINGSWDVYTPTPLGVSVTNVINNLNGTISITFSGLHNLLTNQIVGIVNFDPRIDGYYLVKSITNLTTIVVTSNLTKTATQVFGNGAAFMMQSHRVTTSRDIVSLPLNNVEFNTNLVWVDENENGDWTVYSKTPNYIYNSLPKIKNQNEFTTVNFGSAVANVPTLGYVVGDSGAGVVYHYIDNVNGDGSFITDYFLSYPDTSYGSAIVYSDELMLVGAPDASLTLSQVYIYRIPSESNLRTPVLEQVLSVSGGNFGYSMAISGDSNVLYAAVKDEATELLAVYARNPNLTFTNLGMVLSKPTVVNDNKFSVHGNVLSSITPGQRVSFITQYFQAGTLYVNANLNDQYFVCEGDVRQAIYTGLQVSFSNSGTAGDQLYTVTHTSYDSDADTTTVYTEEQIIATVYNGTIVYAASFNQDIIYTVITGIYDIPTNQTTFYIVGTIQHVSQAGAAVYHSHVNFQLIGTSQSPVWSYGDNFGSSIATNYDGTRVFVGSPNADFTTTDGLHNVSDVGRVWVADAIVENYKVQFDQNLFTPFFAITVAWIPTNNSVIYWNGTPLPTTKYIVLPGNVETNVGTVILIGPVGFKAGDIISFRSYNLVYSQFLMKSITYSDLHPGEKFGASISCNKWASEVMVGAPGGVVNNDEEGAVIRFTCEGRKFGSMSALIQADVFQPTYMYINGYVVNLFHTFAATTNVKSSSTSISVSQVDAARMPDIGIITIQNIYSNNYTLTYQLARDGQGVPTGQLNFIIRDPVTKVITPTTFGHSVTSNTSPTDAWHASDVQIIAPLGDASNVAEVINRTNILNVFAAADSEDRLIISLIDKTLGQAENKLNIMALNGNIITEMGMSLYTKSQTISNPHSQHSSNFGAVVKFNETGSIAVGAPTTNSYLKTQFDYDVNTDLHNQTTFDSNLTEFIDSFTKAGAVYMFDYIPCYNESLLNLSNFIYAQPCNDIPSTSASALNNYGYLSNYGAALDFRNNLLMISAPNYQSGTTAGKVVMYRNNVGTSDWTKYRYPDSVVDISKVQKVQLFDNSTDKTLLSLDYIDPLQGKFLGAVAENLDFVTSIDPAGYNSANYNTGKLVWNKNQVGKIWFNTSTARFLDYHQNDVVYNSKYWGQVFPGSSVDVYTWVESLTPPNQYKDTTGTPYDVTKYAVTFVTDANHNLVPVYYFWVKNTNSLYSLQGKTLSDYTIAQYITNPANSGIAFLAPLRTNTYAIYNAASYINGKTTNLHLGFSTSNNDTPAHIDFKLIRTDYPEDFLTGFPNAKLGRSNPTGVYEKLIDSFAGSDSFGAVVPDPSLPKMLQIGVNIRPRQSMFIDRFSALKNFIEYTNSIIVNYPISEIENLTLLNVYGDNFDTRVYWEYTYWWATGYSSTTKTNLEVQTYADLMTFTPTDGMLVGVAKNGKGKREVYVYSSNVWTRIGLQDGTIQFLSSLYDYADNKIGFGNDFFDSSGFDAHPTVESRYIVRGIFEQIFVDDLFAYRNKALILMFEYISSESVANGGYLPWLNKTSFTDVTYNVRTLGQDTKYRPDNLNLLDGYLNEIKPYHVVIKEFTLSYSALETIAGTVTDFDLPTFFDNNLGEFVSPQLTFGGPKTNQQYSYTDPLWYSSMDYKRWYNHFGLSLVDSPEIIIAFVAKYVNPSDTIMYVDNARGMPATGTIVVDTEVISYSSVDRELGILYGLNRGFNSTQATFHIPGVQIVMDVPSVTLLNEGRAYAFLPRVTAYIDTTLYPAPTTPAVLEAVMAGDKVIGITVKDPGAGYVVLPKIIIDPSISMSFSTSAVNDNGFIVLDTSELNTGDLVRSTGTGSNGLTFIPNGVYYINVLNQADTGLSFITFHKSYRDSVRKVNPISFTSVELLSSDYTHTIGVSAYAVVYANNTLVRGFRTTIKFDRTSYRSHVIPWTPNKFWSSTYHNSLASVNTDRTIGYAATYVHQTGTVTPTGGNNAVFTVENWVEQGVYQAAVTTAGTGYTAGTWNSSWTLAYALAHFTGSIITISGLNLEGSTANNCYIFVTSVNGSGGILTFQVMGVTPTVDTTSLQGAVLPIRQLDSSTDGGAVITVDYSYSGLLPGQASGTSMFFYRVHAPYDFVDGGGAEFKIYRPTFTNDSVVSNYYIKMISSGTGYSQGQTFKILGSNLGGTNGTNDAVIQVTAVNDDTSIFMATVNGTPVNDTGKYYVDAINDTQLAIFADPSMQVPVAYSSFIWNGATSYDTHGYGYPGTDYAYLPEPLYSNMNFEYMTSSITSYANTIWQCIETNHDAVFDPNKWVPLSQSDLGLNALDRIEGFYQPSLDMPAKDVQQLLKGTAYPNPVYYGNSFSPEDILPIDAYLVDRPFYPVSPNIKSIAYDGNEYVAVVDTPTTSVLIRSTDSTIWNTTRLADTPLNITSIVYNNGVYVITTNTATTNLMVSYDLSTWLTISSEENYDDLAYDIGDYDISTVTAPSIPLQKVKYLNGAFFAVGTQILQSTDALTWNSLFQFYSRLTNVINDIDYISISGFTGYVAVGLGSQIVSGANTSAPIINPITRIITSTDGVTWNTESSSLAAYALNGIAHNDSVMVVVGNHAKIYYSSNSTSWVASTIMGSAITTNITSIAYGNNLFVAVGDSGLLLKSSNGITWVQETNSAITTENLHNVTFDGTFFYASGANDTILRSIDGVNWVSQSNLASEDPTYVVKGNDFLFGYGPEELVPGIISDSISMQVTTAPSAYWDLDNTQLAWYKNSGFSMTQVLGRPDSNNQISFANLVVNPIQLAVFYFDPNYAGYTRIYENTSTNLNNPYTYTIDWFNRVVTLNQSIDITQSIMIEVYEVGNGVELARGNSDLIPLRVDPNTGHTMIVLDVLFQDLVTDPLIFVQTSTSNTRLVNNVDYQILPYDTGTGSQPMKIQFNTEYDQSNTKILYSIFADSTTPTNSTQYGYSYPQTQAFTGAVGGSNTYTLTLPTTGQNIADGIVEIDGVRQALGTAYTISGSTLTFSGDPIDETRIIAYTSYLDASRLFATTTKVHAGSSGTLTVTIPYPTVPNPMPNMTYTDVNKAWVTLNGRRLPSTAYHYSSANHLVIPGVQNGDNIIVTAFVDGGSPNPSGFKLLVDKTGVQSAYRANPTDRTWLTVDFGLTDTTMYLNDVSKIVEVVTVTNTVTQISSLINIDNDNDIGFLLNFNTNAITRVEAFNVTKGTIIPSENVELEMYKGAGGVAFYDPHTVVGDLIKFTVYVGNLIETNGERIQFTSVDPTTNTITGLTRNAQNTATTAHNQYDYVYSLSPTRKLDPSQMSILWNSSNYAPFGDPVSVSTTAAAEFLNSGNR